MDERGRILRCDQRDGEVEEIALPLQKDMARGAMQYSPPNQDAALARSDSIRKFARHVIEQLRLGSGNFPPTGHPLNWTHPQPRPLSRRSHEATRFLMERHLVLTAALFASALDHGATGAEQSVVEMRGQAGEMARAGRVMARGVAKLNHVQERDDSQIRRASRRVSYWATQADKATNTASVAINDIKDVERGLRAAIEQDLDCALVWPMLDDGLMRMREMEQAIQNARSCVWTAAGHLRECTRARVAAEFAATLP